MPAVLESAVPPPHLHLTTKASWPSSYSTSHKFSTPPTSSPIPMSPESMPGYLPHLHDSQLPTHELAALPTSGWYGASISAPDQNGVCKPSNPSLNASDTSPPQTGYTSFSYGPSYVTPHQASLHFSSSAQFPKGTAAPLCIPRDASVTTFSPVSEYSRTSDSGQGEYPHSTEDSYAGAAKNKSEPSEYFPMGSNPPSRPRSSPSNFTSNPPSSGAVELPWAMNPMGISSPTIHEHFYAGSTYPSVCPPLARVSRLGPVANVFVLQPRRMYAPIAPHPIGVQRTSIPKRSREDDELSEQSKRRKRSDSNSTMTMELGDEDKLLIQLKDEESMPWKDIASRFQSDLGKTYQIPALQMRLKRLRERMRVWTEADVRALRMAHEYWVQSKFDIISQKVSCM
jgi:hypothetical protein